MERKKFKEKGITKKYECYATNEKWWEPDDEDRNYGRIYGDFASEVFHDEKPAVLDHGIYEALRQCPRESLDLHTECNVKEGEYYTETELQYGIKPSIRGVNAQLS